jgi:hypothetical protein
LSAVYFLFAQEHKVGTKSVNQRVDPLIRPQK